MNGATSLLDLRKRIVRAVEGGLSRRAAAARFAVSQSCAIKLVQRWHTGSVAPAAIGAPKALLRKAAARSIDVLWDAVGKLLQRFAPQECANYFANAGYGLPRWNPL